MLSPKSIVALAAVALPCISAASTPAPLPPSSDPFYQPPAGFKSAAPGTILNSRAINTSFLSSTSNVQAFQLLYRTTAVNGSAIPGVTTVFKPANAALDRFVSYHTAYDSSATQCDPSYTYRQGANQTDLITTFEQSILQDYINKGYIVSSPDYEGPDAAFSAGRLAGTGVLDSMRAVVNFKKTLGFTTSRPMIVGTGYSGGAIATGWAASLQPKYASELSIKGWAFGGTPANLTGTLVYLDNSTFSGFIPAAVAGQLTPSAYLTQFKPLIDSIATPAGLSYINYAATHCATDDLTNFPGKSLLSYEFQSLGPQLLYQPTVAAVLLQNLMGHTKSETPTAPVYMYHASGDEIIPYSNASTLVNTWCNYGADVQFVTYALGGHATTEIGGLAGAMSFVANAFAGTTSKGCSRTTTLFDLPAVLSSMSAPVAKVLRNAFEIAGPNDINIKNDLRTLKKPATL